MLDREPAATHRRERSYWGGLPVGVRKRLPHSGLSEDETRLRFNSASRWGSTGVRAVPRFSRGDIYPMTYSVKEIYYTLQGEGANTGKPAVFCRFAGCNLWTGREEDRETATCRFCDTDFVGTDGPGGGKFETSEELAAAIEAEWPKGSDAEAKRLVVCTGGEPLLQLDEGAIRALHAHGFEVAVETNGTLPAPAGIDWLCVSPKEGAPLELTRGDELKLVYPQENAPPEAFEDLEFSHFSLQPMDGPDVERNTKLAIRYCLKHPRWRLSLQTQKYIGIA